MRKLLERVGLKKSNPAAERPRIDLTGCQYPIYTSGGCYIGMAWKHEPELTQYLLWTKPHGSC